MASKDVREALRQTKADPSLRRIRLIVLTPSKAEEDIFRTYDLGANSFITKPVHFNALVEVMKEIGRYWIEIDEQPNGPEHRCSTAVKSGLYRSGSTQRTSYLLVISSPTAAAPGSFSAGRRR